MQNQLNDRVRQTLGWKTSPEVHVALLVKVAWGAFIPRACCKRALSVGYRARLLLLAFLQGFLMRNEAPALSGGFARRGLLDVGGMAVPD